MSQTTNTISDEEFESRSRAAFQASVERLDGATRSRLNQARQRAVDAARQPGLGLLPGLWLPAGALATVAALGMAIFLASSFTPHRAGDVVAVEDAELLSAKDNLDLYAEDPEFFEWAGAPEHASAAPAPDRG
jgi:hypothetical protein